eukprot:CAMPEP_0204090374 /NCGR_PEP_ID=MMETSP0360-20130528/188866_1 /ASSEMBLY_ACC=CAM_ASM_000342 /TAXON_ID=268821 /ORGANISM="Scrippsiella Hangoei, Strain SHTV-5" /LENGTH=530 /DNA_ID=CAMNT_0051039633 /DNA_START=76 /DNA_END=1665 /DNA_ORIENTATION=-
MATKDQDHKDLGAAADQKGKESRNYDATEHKMSLAELKEKFETAIDEQNPKESKGLSDQEAKNRLLRDGPNAMTPPKQTPEIVKFLMQFTNMFMILLMVASALSPKESKGLSEQEAKSRYQRDGPNAMTPPKQTPEIVKFLMQFTNMFMILLMFASALSFLAYGLDKTEAVNLYCGSALVIIVFLQCLASYLEERKSHAVMNSLKSMMPSQCSVVRDGMPRRIPAAELVIGDIVLLKGGDRVPADLRLIQTSGLKVEAARGDIVLLKGGDRVPADLRLIQTSGLKVESSSLTGEPDAFEMSVAHTHEEPFESKNLAFNTSQCTEGAAVGVVIRTSDRTLIGMVAKLATATKVQVSTLQKEVTRIVKFVTMLAIFLALCIEPDAFEMSVAHTHEEPFESKNLAFNTSQCTEGSAVCVVIRTADRTLIGLVAKLATATKVQVSTLQKEISRIVKFVTILALLLALMILIIGFSQGVRWQLVINLVITVFCANVPQGLPATVTSCLGIAAKRMHLRHVLVKNLEVIETLGSAS